MASITRFLLSVLLLAVTALSLAAEDKPSESGIFSSRTKLAERLFKFHDVYARCSEGGQYIWLTRTGECAEQPAHVSIFQVSDDLATLKLKHDFDLLNPVRPTVEFVTSDGKFFVTLDEAGRCGNSPRDLVIYNLASGTHTARSITEFLPESILAPLKPPFYMGGDGLREWQRFSRSQKHYDDRIQTFYPTDPRRAKSTFRIPFIAIQLATGKVDARAEPRPDLVSEEPGVTRGFDHRHIEIHWAMPDGGRKIKPTSLAPVEYIAIIQTKHQGVKELQLAYRRNAKTGSFEKVDWNSLPFGKASRPGG